MDQQYPIGTYGQNLQWARLGTFRFTAVTGGYVQMVNGPDHSECADAAGFRWVGP